MSDETAPVTISADQSIAATQETVDVPSTHVPAVGGVSEVEVKDETDGKKVRAAHVILRTRQDDSFSVSITFRRLQIFIGNLAYSTTEEELNGFIAPAEGKVVEVNLPKRFNNRPAGYAFVVYETEEQANAAVEKLDKQVLNEREISVAIAKPAAPKKPRKKAGSSKAVTTGTAESGTTAAEDHVGNTEGEATDGQGTKSKKKKAKRPARRLPEEHMEEAEDRIPAVNGDTSAQQVTDGSAKKPKAKRNRKPKSAQGEHSAEGAGEARIDDEGATEGQKPRRAPRKPTTLGEPSKTLLFVANLPFSVDEAALTEAFTSLSITPKSSKIITKPSYHYVDGKRERGPRRSKGFAFVEVENEEAQQLAIEKLHGYKMQDREITIKVANERMHQEDEHGNEEALKQEGEKEAVKEEQKQEQA
ncbi:hypothetical protein QFC19_008870 [Naganishia cerealis]|uniref:Uncharacterized protein n=1 Tax=Naganishia cerealis TaxID=610337 RepID=A0ACC2UYF5_9TREE|nr:hypothetical protein QFC19_008870 [Naganishia cerealis]